MLLIGYGNPGRGDDGIGPAFAERIERTDIPGIDIVIDYQLTVEHALSISSANQVIFADAQIGIETPFQFDKATASATGDLISHSLSPAEILSLAGTLYGASPAAFVLGIAGSDFREVREGLSKHALRNLDLAEAFFLDWVARGSDQGQSCSRLRTVAG